MTQTSAQAWMTMPRLIVVDMGDEATPEKAVECVVAGDVDMLDNFKTL